MEEVFLSCVEPVHCLTLGVPTQGKDSELEARWHILGTCGSGGEVPVVDLRKIFLKVGIRLRCCWAPFEAFSSGMLTRMTGCGFAAILERGWRQGLTVMVCNSTQMLRSKRVGKW
jgi:hypothetical protein